MISLPPDEALHASSSFLLWSWNLASIFVWSSHIPNTRASWACDTVGDSLLCAAAIFLKNSIKTGKWLLDLKINHSAPEPCEVVKCSASPLFWDILLALCDLSVCCCLQVCLIVHTQLARLQQTFCSPDWINPVNLNKHIRFLQSHARTSKSEKENGHD